MSHSSLLSSLLLFSLLLSSLLSPLLFSLFSSPLFSPLFSPSLSLSLLSLSSLSLALFFFKQNQTIVDVLRSIDLLCDSPMPFA